MRRQTRKKKKKKRHHSHSQRHDLPTRLCDIRDAVVSMLHCARQLLLARIETPGACASILSGTRRLSLFRPAARLILSYRRCMYMYLYPTSSPTHSGLNQCHHELQVLVCLLLGSSQEEKQMLPSHIPPLPALQSASSLERLCHIPTGSVASSFDWETWMSLRGQGIAQCPHPAAKMRCDQPST